MKKIIALMLSISLSSWAAADETRSFDTGRFDIQVGVRTSANLIYHIDCLARSISCTYEIFEQFWRTELNLSNEDRKFLKEWADLRTQIQRSDSGSDHTLKIKSSVPIFDDAFESKIEALRKAEFVASNPGVLRDIWNAQANLNAAERFNAIYEHFRPRFMTWWMQHEGEAVTFLRGLEIAMKKAKGAELLSAAAKFYRADFRDRNIYLHLFLQPTTKQTRSRAQRIGAHMAIEMLVNEKPEDRVSVVVHELAHHVFSHMPPKQMAKLADDLIATGPAGMAAWNLINEVQATVIGNMLAERNVQSPERYKKLVDTPQSFYADEAIDLGARSALTVFEQALNSGRAMSSSFPGAFVAALKSGLGEKMETPEQLLRSFAVTVNDGNSPWPLTVRETVHSWSTWSFDPLAEPDFVEMLEKYPGMSAVVVATPDEIPLLSQASNVLGATSDEISAALGTARGVVIVTKRSPLAYAFLIIARNPKATKAMISTLVYCELKPGTCATIQ